MLGTGNTVAVVPVELALGTRHQEMIAMTHLAVAVREVRLPLEQD